MLTSWLIGRRAAAFDRHGQKDPRPGWVLWAGCLIPVVNWFFAPLFVLELAEAEGAGNAEPPDPAVVDLLGAHHPDLRWATWTTFKAHEPQAVADNTVTVIVAYLAGRP